MAVERLIWLAHCELTPLAGSTPHGRPGSLARAEHHVLGGAPSKVQSKVQSPAKVSVAVVHAKVASILMTMVGAQAHGVGQGVCLRGGGQAHPAGDRLLWRDSAALSRYPGGCRVSGAISSDTKQLDENSLDGLG